MNITEYVEQHEITAVTVHVGPVSAQEVKDEKWSKGHHRYVVTLRMGDKTISSDYRCNPMFHMPKAQQLDALPMFRGARAHDYKGPGQQRTIYDAEMDAIYEKHIPPKFTAGPAEFLNCLVMDASGTDQAFEDWAPDLGYDPDSRKAEAIFHKCRDMAGKLRQFFGAAELERLMYEVEGL